MKKYKEKIGGCYESEKDTLLLIGNQDSDRSTLRTIFESDYFILEAVDIPQGSLLLKQNNIYVAAVVADVPLENEHSVQELMDASKQKTDNKIPVILLVDSKDEKNLEERGFLLGASDVVLKPYTTATIQRRVQVLVDLHMYQWHLEELVEVQKQDVRKAYQMMVDTLSTIIENRSVESGNHNLRMRSMTKILLEEVAKYHPVFDLTPEIIEVISAASVFHDLGKIAIPDAILQKPGKLTPEEFELMASTMITLDCSVLIDRKTEGMSHLSYYAHYNMGTSFRLSPSKGRTMQKVLSFYIVKEKHIIH